MAEPLNKQSIESEIIYNDNAPKFQTMIENLFKTHVKSCSNLYKEGEKQ